MSSRLHQRPAEAVGDTRRYAAHDGPESAPPRLSDLPEPPPGRTGWPWTEEPPRLPSTMEDGREWPRITVVTPSLDQAEFLEMTLRSVQLQGYPNLEHIVVDGGSTDGSVEILERYDPWLTHWVSEPDHGQSHAINKGFARATGQVLAWLNSDDTYFPGTLRAAAEALAGEERKIFVGAMEKVYVDGDLERFERRSSPTERAPFQEFPILKGEARADFHFIQPPMFWTRDLWEVTGGLDERYHLVMDKEWCNRAMAAGAEVETTERLMARFPLHPGSKSQDQKEAMNREEARMYLRLGRTPDFRLPYCVLSAVTPLSRSLSWGAARARREGKPWKARTLAVGSRAARAARSLLVRAGLGHDTVTRRSEGEA